MPTLAAHYNHDKPDSARTPHLLCGSRFWPDFRLPLPSAAAIARQVSLALWILGAIYSISFIVRSIPAQSQKA